MNYIQISQEKIDATIKDLKALILHESKIHVAKTVNKILECLDACKYKTAYNILRFVNTHHEWYEAVSFLGASEVLYKKGLTEYYCNSFDFPSGSDNAFGKDFEKYVNSIIKKYYVTKKIKNLNADNVIALSDEELIIIEIKCGYTEKTREQVARYCKQSKVPNFITVNGHANSINFNCMDIYNEALEYSEMVLNGLISVVKKQDSEATVLQLSK